MTETVADTTTEAAPHKDLEIYSSEQYFHALARDIADTKSGDRVAIMTMSFEPSEPLVQGVLEEFKAAGERGVEVAIGVDAFTFLVNDDKKSMGPLWLPMPFGQATYKKRIETLEDITKGPNASYSVINKPNHLFSNPFAGRSHLKLGLVNDKVYIGGPNFHKSERTDMVVGLEDPEVADWLYSLSQRIISAGRTDTVLGSEDQDVEIDSDTRILIDAGRPHQSAILDEALSLIDNANDSLIASFQYFPTGIVSEHLAAASKRGVEVRPFHNHPSVHSTLVGFHERLAMLKQVVSLPGEFFKDQLPKGANVLHSKAIASDNSAMVGSHNNVYHGVKYGTPEIALLRHDAEFAHQVGGLIIEQVRALSIPATETEPTDSDELFGLPSTH